MEKLWRFIAKDFAQYEKHFKELTQVVAERRILPLSYPLETQGKQLRPVLTLLSARLFGKCSIQTYAASVIIELVHLASLLHDDVVDNAQDRRGKRTVYHQWGKGYAVLVGDYYWSLALQLAMERLPLSCSQMITRAVLEMSASEVIQLHRSEKLAHDREGYFDVIRGKTAALFRAAAYVGSFTGGASQEEAERQGKLMLKVGMLFQIRDDIRDFLPSKDTGKIQGIDLRERKISLPMICALEQMSKKNRDELLAAFHKNGQHLFEEVCEHILCHGGLEGAYDCSQQIKEEAVVLLEELPDNQARKMMGRVVEKLSNLTVEMKQIKKLT